MAKHRTNGSLLVFQILCLVVAAIAAWNLMTLLQAYAYLQEKLGTPLPIAERLTGYVLWGSRVIVPVGIVLLMARYQRPAAIRMALLAIWLAFFILPAANALKVLATEVFILPGVRERLGWEVGLGLAASIAATAYLCTSTVVARTFARQPRIDGVFD